MTCSIDWETLNHAIEYYQSCGYHLIDVPWIVPNAITNITKPPERKAVSTYMGDLVGSGEQSFLHLMNNGALSPGKYCCLTPCFRDEATYDELHLPYFMKVELINTINPNWDTVISTADDALRFLQRGVYCSQIVLNDPTCVEGVSMDIVTTKGIELGSYGHRKSNDLEWVYGTGLAEPRYNYAKGKDI